MILVAFGQLPLIRLTRIFVVTFFPCCNNFYAVLFVFQHSGAKIGKHDQRFCAGLLFKSFGKLERIAQYDKINILTGFTKQQIAHKATDHIHRHVHLYGQLVYFTQESLRLTWNFILWMHILGNIKKGLIKSILF